MNEEQSELAALREELYQAKEARDTEMLAGVRLQQRLTAAEQRNSVMCEALETLNNYGFDPNSGSGSWGEIRITLEDWNLIQAALKPTESGVSECEQVTQS